MYRDELLAGLCRRGLDESVVQAVARVPREVFVPEDLRDRAWEDGALPIGAGQTISQPSLVAYMVALLDLRGGERVLDVGTGSGYHAAARHSLDEAGVHNVTLLVGDGARGAPEHAPYHAINVAAAVEGDLPDALVEQLIDGGRVVAPIRNGDERLVVARRYGDRLEHSEHGAVRFVPLVREGRAGKAG